MMASRSPIGVLWATIILWGAMLLVIWALATYAHGDECNPDLVSDLTPKCQLYKPQFRQCRPDQDLNKDMDLLDNLCAACPAGQCLTGITLSGGPLCTPCGGCAGFMQCAPPTVVIGHDANCNDICSSNFCDPNPCQNGGQCILTGNGFLCLCPCTCSGTLCETCVTTTTGVSTTTGTGATTTSTTGAPTTTTLPLFPSTTFLVVPGYPTDTASQNWAVVSDNVMICGRFVPPVGITNATKAAFLLTAGPAENDYTVALYPDDDAGARVMQCHSSITFQTLQQCTSMTPYTLTAGTAYRVCACRQNNFLTADSYLAAAWTVSSGWASEQNGFVVSVGTATNLCTGGNTSPATTGALVQNNSVSPPIVLLSRE